MRGIWIWGQCFWETGKREGEFWLYLYIALMDVFHIQNEAMTGILLFNGPFSRITFGLFEDSGLAAVATSVYVSRDAKCDNFCRWYSPNYEVAQELAWGRNRGCSIPHGSCAEYIQNQQARFDDLLMIINTLVSTDFTCVANVHCHHSAMLFKAFNLQL